MTWCSSYICTRGLSVALRQEGCPEIVRACCNSPGRVALVPVYDSIVDHFSPGLPNRPRVPARHQMRQHALVLAKQANAWLLTSSSIKCPFGYHILCHCCKGHLGLMLTVARLHMAPQCMPCQLQWCAAYCLNLVTTNLPFSCFCNLPARLNTGGSES